MSCYGTCFVHVLNLLMTDYLITQGTGNYGICINGVELTDNILVTLPLSVLMDIKEQLKPSWKFFPNLFSYIELKEKNELYKSQSLLITPLHQEIAKLQSEQQKLTQIYQLKQEELKTAQATANALKQ